MRNVRPALYAGMTTTTFGLPAVAAVLGRGSGLVAALRPGEGPPSWVVTGSDARGVARAASLLGEQLRDSYAVAVSDAGTVPVPVR